MDKLPLSAAFRGWTGHEPSFLVRAPGRVNLIGEHTDYNGFPVLPIAISHSIRAAAAPRNDRTVSIRNMHPEFPPREFRLAAEIPREKQGDWSNYVRAAASRLTARYGGQFRGADILFAGEIPSPAGLSSSSALVIASALALIAANDITLPPAELAEMMAEGERYVGTEGGGMDQAICLLGRERSALRLDFFPLRHTVVPFPDNHSVIVAHSLVRAAKTGEALAGYNRRPAECRLAVAIINRVHTPAFPLRRLGDITRAGICSFRNVDAFIAHTFPRESYSLGDVARITGMTREEIRGKCLTTQGGIPVPEPADGFRIRQRALHVLTEAGRVEEGCRALEKNDAVEFGRLMDESHRSCDEQYGISTPELNALTAIMRNAGARGARLTGAGFGGCAIALARDEDAGKIIAAVKSEYYGAHPVGAVDDTLREEVLFAVKPASGAAIETLIQR